MYFCYFWGISPSSDRNKEQISFQSLNNYNLKTHIYYRVCISIDSVSVTVNSFLILSLSMISFSITFWRCSDSVVFFYYILEMFRQCGIFCFSITFWRCSDSVVFFYYILEMFRQCGIFLLYFGVVPTVWYFFCFSFYSTFFIFSKKCKLVTSLK